MQFSVPADMEVLIEKRLASGAFGSVWDVFRQALQTLEAQESWTEDERGAMDEKLARAETAMSIGKTHGDAARKKLADLRQAHLARLG